MNKAFGFFVISLALAWAGCDDDDSPLECGDGTFDQEGVCVPDYDDICGVGTAYDEETGMCLSDVDPLCPPGQVFDEETMECVEPTYDIEEGEENNDPLSGGDPLAVDLPAENETLVIGGVIGAPVEMTNDWGEVVLRSDYDVIELEATRGQVIRIEGTSLGSLPNVAFLFSPSALFSGDGTAKSPARYGMATESRNPTRTMRILEDGPHWLFVTDRSNLAGYGGTGGDDMRYAIAITTLPTPEDQQVTMGDAVTVDLMEDFSVIEIGGVTPGSILRLSMGDPEVSALMVRHIFMLDADDEIVDVHADELALDLFSGSYIAIPMDPVSFVADRVTIRLYVDYDIFTGGDTMVSVELAELEADEPGTLDDEVLLENVELDTTGGESLIYSFDVGAVEGAIIRFTFEDIVLDAEPIALVLNEEYNMVTGFDPVWVGTDEFFFAADAGQYYVELFNAAADVGTVELSLSIAIDAPVAMAVEDTEPNDYADEAQALDISSLPLRVDGSISVTDSVDFYTVSSEAGGRYGFYLYSQTADVYMSFSDEVDSLGIADGWFEVGQEIANLDLAPGTTYLIEVSGFAESFDYFLMVNEIPAE